MKALADRRTLLSLAVLLSMTAALGGGTHHTVFAQAYIQSDLTPDSDVHELCVEVLPQVELFAAVLSQTSLVREFGPTGEGNEYFRAVTALMHPYSNHEAVRLCQRLVSGGFGYGWPMEFALHLGPLPDLEPVAEYPDDMVRQAGGEQNLEEFRLAVRDLAQESKFLDFYASWQDKYGKWIISLSARLDLEKMADWVSGFFGWGCRGFHVVLAPAMFRAGYGVRVYMADGTVTVYAVICCAPDAILDPVFPSAGRQLEMLIIHELGHSFVNPTFAKYRGRIGSYESLYRKVASLMVSQKYTDVYIFFNEQVLRGLTATASKDFYGEAAFEMEVEANEKEGFYLTRFMAGQFSDYGANRSVYPRFTDFALVLLDRIDDGPIQDARKGRLVGLGLGVAAIVMSIGGLLLVVRRRMAGRIPGNPGSRHAGTR